MELLGLCFLGGGGGGIGGVEGAGGKAEMAGGGGGGGGVSTLWSFITGFDIQGGLGSFGALCCFTWPKHKPHTINANADIAILLFITLILSYEQVLNKIP